jgi:enoyl-CoA hydratase/carnithine racemase
MGLDYEKRDGVAYITLNNPAKANILDKRMSDDISAAWIDLWEDRHIRCAILTGAGDKHFCGGHNLAPRPGVTEEEREFLRTQKIFWPLAGTVHGQKTGVDGRMGDHYPRVFKPVIAAVNGWAAGAGMYILLASTDIRIASAENARFKFGLTTQGWVGNGPGAALLTKQLRYADAMKILLTDLPFDAAEALRVGLVNEVVPHAEPHDEGIRGSFRRLADRSGLARAEPHEPSADPDHHRWRRRPQGLQRKAQAEIHRNVAPQGQGMGRAIGGASQAPG